MFELTLATTQENFDSLHRAESNVRIDVNTVTVNKEALMHLLYDHSQLVGICEDDFRQLVYLVHGSREATCEASQALREYRCIDIKN